jgi:hypothetical protein
MNTLNLQDHGYFDTETPSSQHRRIEQLSQNEYFLGPSMPVSCFAESAYSITDGTIHVFRDRVGGPKPPPHTPVRREQIPIRGNEALSKAWRETRGIRDQVIELLRTAEQESAGAFVLATVHLERRATEPDTSYMINSQDRECGANMEGEVLKSEHDTLFVMTGSRKREADEQLWLRLCQTMKLLLTSKGFPNINVEISHRLCFIDKRATFLEQVHPIREYWHDLAPKIRAILGDCPDVTSLYYSRFGIYGPGTNEPEHRPVTIMAEVSRGYTIDWPSRMQQIRRVLDSPPFAGRLDDVTMELIRQGHRHPLRWCSSGFVESEYESALKSYPTIRMGRSISALGDEQTKGSTVGGIVELKFADCGEWQKYGLSSFRSIARTKLSVLEDPVEDHIFRHGMKPNTPEHESYKFRVQQPAAAYVTESETEDWSVGELYAASGVRRSRRSGYLLDWALHTLDVPDQADNSVSQSPLPSICAKHCANPD